MAYSSKKYSLWKSLLSMTCLFLNSYFILPSIMFLNSLYFDELVLWDHLYFNIAFRIATDSSASKYTPLLFLNTAYKSHSFASAIFVNALASLKCSRSILQGWDDYPQDNRPCKA